MGGGTAWGVCAEHKRPIDGYYSILRIRDHRKHLQVDVELREPLFLDTSPKEKDDPNAPSYVPNNKCILVSLPVLARWNSTPVFQAEQILRESHKFDVSEPQFFYKFKQQRQASDERCYEPYLSWLIKGHSPTHSVV